MDYDAFIKVLAPYRRPALFRIFSFYSYSARLMYLPHAIRVPILYLDKIQDSAALVREKIANGLNGVVSERCIAQVVHTIYMVNGAEFLPSCYLRTDRHLQGIIEIADSFGSEYLEVQTWLRGQSQMYQEEQQYLAALSTQDVS